MTQSDASTRIRETVKENTKKSNTSPCSFNNLVDADVNLRAEESVNAEINGGTEATDAHALAILWARRYYMSIVNRKAEEQIRQSSVSVTDLTSAEGRKQTAETLLKHLPLASAQAWTLTEKLLSREVSAHGIDSDLLNPLQIADDSRTLFQKALDAYAEGVTPRRLSVVVGSESGAIREKYTAHDPRVIGFVSMQFHYTGQTLIDGLTLPEQALFSPYLKVMDDHMYMPLRAAYQAAADYPLDSPILKAVQRLLPVSSAIARKVCDKIRRINPNYHSYSGSLNNSIVKTSSIRDVEMFQVYLCLCVLEESIRSVQRELFPLCVMLYPQLKVEWRLVQDMLQALTWEMTDHLSTEDMAIFVPFLRLLSDMFSKEVFQPH